jgi:hypothetical protein
MVTATGTAETAADLVQAIHDTLTHADLNNWTTVQEADISLTADNTQTEWWNSGWVFQHTGSGLHLLITLTWANDREISIAGDDAGARGISFALSADWVQENPNGGDSGNIPAGSPGWPGDVENTEYVSVRNPLDARNQDMIMAKDAFLDTEFNNDRDGIGAIPLQSSALRKDDPVADYNVMANDDMLVVAAEGDQLAGFYAFEDVSGSKFFDDGITPAVARFHRSGHTGGSTTLDREHIFPIAKYGWNTFYAEHYSGQTDWRAGVWPGTVGSYKGPVGFAEWGNVNPDPSDDTYFYRPPILYQASDQEVPVAELNSVHPAQWGDGLSHGDTVTVTEGTYKIIHLRPSSMNDWPIRCAMRFE